MHEKIVEEKFKDDKIDIVLHYYLCTYESGTMKLNEHEDFTWVEKKILINMILPKGTETYFHFYNFFYTHIHHIYLLGI